MKTFNLCAGLAALAFANCADAEPTTACVPTAVELRTDFPNSAQNDRQHGVVTVGVVLNELGDVATTRLVASSGRAELDRAALASARRYWKFDASNCGAEEKSREFRVSVKFERPQGVAVSGTLNRKSLARIRALEAKDECQSSRQGNETTVFSCRSNEFERVVNRDSQP